MYRQHLTAGDAAHRRDAAGKLEFDSPLKGHNLHESWSVQALRASIGLPKPYQSLLKPLLEHDGANRG